MNWSQLEAFAETCRQGSYTKAAEHLYLSQPALHHKVKQLEYELGMPLLLVQNRRVVPTAEGNLVLTVADRIMTEVHALEAHFESVRSEQIVRIGATSLLAATALGRLIERWDAAETTAMIHVVVLDPSELQDALVNHRVDFAVAYVEYVTNELTLEPLMTCPLICVASPQHPLADGMAHDPLDLLAYPFALTHKGMNQRTKVENWIKKTTGRSDLTVSFEASTAALLANITAMTDSYITFIPQVSLQAFNLVQIPIRGLDMQSHSAICYLPSQRFRPAVELALKSLRETVGGSRDEVTPIHSAPLALRSGHR